MRVHEYTILNTTIKFKYIFKDKCLITSLCTYIP